MALWNKVLSGFNREEETVNFGARTVAENNGSLYETSTIATIQSDGEVTEKPKVSASVQYSRACIAIDKSITVFENETCEEILLSVGFGSLITCYCMSEDGAFLFVALTNGILYCLHLLRKGQIIFTKNVTNDRNIIVKIFLQEESHKCMNISLVAKNGAIYRISKFNAKLVDSAITNDNNIGVEDAVKDIQCSQLFKGFSHDEVIYAAIGTEREEISIAMVCSDMLFMWPSEQYNDFNTLSYKYTKVQFLRKCMAMLCLRTDHVLKMVCSQTLLGLNMYSKPVLDFVVIENDDNSMCQIVMLIAPENNHGTHILRVVSFPELEQKFQINVPVTTYLVEILDSCDETIIFMEGVNDIGTNTENIDTIRVKAVLESIPEYQLQRLLRRQQFDAAEAFAEKFNLSVEPIYCAKAALFISQLGPWAKKASDTIQLDTLIGMLDKIQNVQYVVEFCSKALIPEYQQMRKIHLYACKRIVENTEKMKSNEHLNLLHSMNDTLHKLETFHMIWGCQRDIECYDDDTMKEWTRFSRANFMDEYKMHLSLGEMEAATLIWVRHHPNMVKNISAKTVQDIFATLPEKISPSPLWPWLSHFVPTLLSLIPHAVSEIILWGCRKIKLLEQSHRTDWPQIGIDFADRFIKLLKFEENDQSSYFHQEYTNQNSALKQFVLLMQALSDIRKLKVTYRLTISLDAYVREPIEVSHILLDKIHVDAIPEFVNTFLKQYMLNNSLKNDHVFSSYIQKNIRNSKSWWSGEEAPWEKRAVTIITLIHNIENKLQHTLEVLKKANVPWSSTMVTLAETSSSIDHVLASKIRTEYNCVPIKLILKQYGYECIGINDKLISRIIKENRDEMIAHINQLTKNDLRLRKEAFSSCTNYYLSRGNFKKAMEVLHSLDDDVLLYCCVQIVNYVTSSLSLKKIPKPVAHYVEMLGWVKFQLEDISKKCKHRSYYCSNIIANIDEVKSLYLLKKDFHINVTLKEYLTKKNAVLQDYIKELYKDIEKHGGLSMVYKKAIKVADLLKLERLNATSLLLEWTKDVNILKYFTGCKGSHLNLTAEECPHINKMCLSTLQDAEIDANVAAIVKNLSASALCVCSNGELSSTLSSNIWATLFRESLSKHCTNSVDTKQEEIPRANWKLYKMYKDPAVSADQLLLPLFRDTISIQRSYMANSKSDQDDRVTGDAVQLYNQPSTEKLLRDLLDRMRKLKAEHSDYCLLQIIKTLYFGLLAVPNMDPTSLTEIRTVFLHFLMNLLRKLVCARTFDLQLGLSCLFMLPDSDACKWISAACKSFQVDYTRHLTVSVLGYEYFRLTNNQNLMQNFKDHKALHCWAQRLSKYSISYKEILISDTTGKREILQHIMDCSNDDMISLLEDFCCNFGFDIHDCLLLYLQTLMKTWSPKLNISTSNGKKELHIHEDEVNELRRKCNAVAAKIPDKAALKNCITAVLPQINFYHYEVFIILMDIIEDKNIEHRNYFCYLQNYTRSGKPTRIERDEWMHLNPGHTSLPPIAEWRLPFLPKIELWKLITPELNLKTYEKWLDIAPILKLQPHIICTLAIKGEVIRAWENVNSNHKAEKWSLYPRNSSLLSDIKKCIERMTGPDALYYGTAALYYVVNHTPPGADQVAAAQECYNYAQFSARKSTTLEEGMLEKIKFKYLRFTSEHILRTHGLGNNNYLPLIGNPHKLVRELYTDESIPQRYRCVIDHRPDINSAANALSELFSINLIKLRLELLQEWLQPDCKYMKINESITDTFLMRTSSEQNSNYDDNLLRACYILDHGNLELSANFLINIGFGDTNEDYSPEVRYRALHVLQTIVDTTTLQDLTKRDLQTIRQYMKSLKYISKLESLGLNYSVNTFESCSKHELVQILWKTQSYSREAVVVIAQICIDFEIYEYSLWDKNLTQLSKLLMVNELKKILLQVRNISVIVNSNGYLSGWQVIVSEPFRKMDVLPNSEQIDSCIEALRLLHSCPIVHMLRFTDLVHYCFQGQQPHLAAALLPFLNDVDKKHVLETIRKSFKLSNVLEDLNNLSLAGVLSVSHCSRIIQDALAEIKTQ